MKLIRSHDLYVGTSTERSTNFSSPPSEGTSYYETDTNLLYTTIFSSWVAITHNPVTLTSTLDANLLGITNQELSLDTQSEAKFFAGPVTGGGSGAPSFRDIDASDVPDDVVGLDATLDANLLDKTGKILSLDSQSANEVFAGPTSGSSEPSFRSLVADDVPDDAVTISTTLDSNLLDKTGKELDLDDQAPHLFFAGPSSGLASSAPSFRNIQPSDLPTITNASAAVSLLSILPGLRGLWTTSTVDSNGDTIDHCPLSNDMIAQGGPLEYGLDNYAPHVILDGSTQYLRAGYSAEFDITGNESYISSEDQGMTVGGWFKMTASASGYQVIMGRDGGPGNEAWLLERTPSFLGEGPFFAIYDGGYTGTAISTAIPVGDWAFIVGRYARNGTLTSGSPQPEVTVYLNDTINTVGHPTGVTSIPTPSEPITIGAADFGGSPSSHIPCNASLCFITATALSNTIIEEVYAQTRGLFGV